MPDSRTPPGGPRRGTRPPARRCRTRRHRARGRRPRASRSRAIGRWGTALEDHPFDLLYQLGFAVTVNVDNRTMSRTSLTRELALLAETFDYRLEDLEAFQLNAAAGAFLSVEEREELIELIGEGFSA